MAEHRASAAERSENRRRAVRPAGEVATILLRISSKLFFLSTKSQEQVTEDYRLLSREIRSLGRQLEEAINRKVRVS
jgi:hypothetical protein